MDGFIKIYRVVNGATEELKEVTLSKRSYWHHELGGIDYVMLFFSLDSDNLAVTTPFKEGDFIINPINGDKYFIMDLAVPNENNSGFWDFQLRFDSIVTALSRNICKYTLQGGNPELSWKLTDSMSGSSVLKQAILGSLAHDDITQSGNWVIDTTSFAADIDFTEQFTYSLNGDKYTELFDKICENYGCEWWNVKSGNDNIIYFGIAKTPEGSEIEFVDTETNALAHQLQIISTSTQKSGEDYATKLYYRGSERNVPRNYNLTTGVKRAPVSYLNDSRLPLPDNTPYIASSDFADKPHACIELYETNDKIYPRRLEHVTQVLYYKAEAEGIEQRVYCIKTDNPVAALADFKADPSKGNLSIAFSSGSLNGRTFEVQLHRNSLSRATVYNLDGTPFEGNKSGCWYEIVMEGQGDDYMPNQFLHPSSENGGDECQLFNWIAFNTTTNQLTAPMLQLIADARAELYAAAQERFAEICVLNTSFTCVPAKVGTPSSLLLNIGQSVNVNTAPVLVGASFTSRIRAIEVMLYNANDRTYTVGIGAKYSRLGRIINSLRENREDLKNVEDEVNNQTNPTTYVIRENSGFQAVRLKQDGTFIPSTLSFSVFGVTGRTEVNCTDRSSIRIKFDNGAWVSPDEEGNFQVSGNFQTITAAAFTDESLEVLRASMVLHKIEDGSRAAALVISNPLQIIEVNEDWDVGYAFADDTDSYETDIYCFSKGGNLPMTDIDIFLEATNGSKVAIVTDGVAVGNTTINGAPIRVTFIVQDNKGHLSIAFTNAAVEQLFTIPVLVGITALVDGATSEISQTANIVFRQKGVDGTDGTDGSAASVRKLIVSPDYIVSDAEGNLLSRQLTFSGQIVVGDGLPSVLPDAKFKAIIDGNAVSGNITSPYTLPVSCQTVVIEMYDETGLTLLDSQSIPIVQQGRVGKDAVTVILSNENHTLSLEDDRDVINYSGSGTSVKLVTAEYEFVPKDYSTYPEEERWQHLQPGEFFVHAAGTDITVGARSILGNSFAFGNASNLVGGTTGDRAAYIDFTIYFRAVGETQINYVTKRQNFSVAPSGFNVAIITLYKRSAEELAANDFTAACAAATPDPITAIRYNFITKALSTLPAGWTSIMPRTNEAALWAVQATARSRTDEDSIAVTEFSAPTKVLPSGINQAITVWSEYDGYLDEDADMIEITDENGLHVISNNMESLNLDENDDNNDSIYDIGVLIFVELNKTTLTEVKRHNLILSLNDSTNAITYREFTKAISGTTTNQSLAAFLNSVGGNEQDGFNFVTVSSYGDCKEASKVYTSLRDNLDSLGIARFAFDEEETTFAAIGKPGLIYGAGILAIDTWYTSATVFVENGNFANSASQLHSETVELFCRATDADIDNGVVHAPTGTVRFSFLTHRIISGSTSPWSQDFPEPDAKRTPCYRIHATALSASDTDDILPTEWSEPERYVIDGADVNPNLLRQAGFQEGRMDCWNPHNGQIVANDYEGRNAFQGSYESGEYLNLLQQQVTGAGHNILRPNTTYTLSWWGKSTNGYKVFLYPNAIVTGEGQYSVDGEAKTSLSDMGTQFDASADYEFHYITFKTLASFAGTSGDGIEKILWRLYAGTASICMPKLEVGVNPTAFMLHEADLQGDNAIRVDLDNQADLVSLDASGKVRFARSIVVKARIFDGGVKATQGVTSNLSANALKIGGCTPTVSALTNGEVTITWAFTKGMQVAATQVPIALSYTKYGVTSEYTATFTFGVTYEDTIYQLMTSPSEVSFSLDGSTNTLSPSSVDLYCGYTKDIGDGNLTTVQNPDASRIESSAYYLYYREKTAGAWGAWKAYTGKITVSRDTAITDYEFCISTATAANSVTDSNIWDRECVPVVKDGKNGVNAIRVDLDNENDSMLYSASKGLLSGNVVSTARLFDGAVDKSTDANCSWQITAVGCTLSVNGSSVTSSTDRNIVVNGMTAATAKVTATATYTDAYNNQHVKSAVLTLKKIMDRDKYDIKLSPNAIFYNKNLTYATKQISISANKIAADGTKTENIALNSAGIYVAAYYKANASASAGWSQVGNAFSVTEILAAANDNILFELRKVKDGQTYSVSDATTYTVEDYETIPINKAENGAKTAIVSLYTRSDSAITKQNFLDLCSNNHIGSFEYSFVTKSLTATPPGWSETPPTENGKALWCIQATAQSQTDTDTIAPSEFSDPVKVLPNGLNTVLTAHSSTTYNRTSNQLALTIVDEDGTHTTQNGFFNSSTRPGSATSGALKVFELDPSSLSVLSTKIINIYTAETIDEINTYLSSIANDSIVAVCAYGNAVPMFSRYQGASGLDNFLGTLGCPRFRLNDGSGTVSTRETFAFIGGKFVTPGAGILAISTGSVDVSVFIKDGVFVNGQTQLKSETVTLYGRFVNKAAATTSCNSIGTLSYNFSTHLLTSTPTGWSQEFQEADANNYPCFMIQATASNVNDIDEILGSEWSAPVEYVKNGEGAPNFVWSSAYIQVNLDKNNNLINDIVSEVMEAYIGGSLKNVNSVLRLEVDGTTVWNGSWVAGEAGSLGVEEDSSAPLWVSGGSMYLGFTFKPTRTETPGTVKTLTCYFTILDNNGVAKTYSSSIKLKFNTGNYPGENATKLELIANKTANLPFLANAGSGHYINFYTSSNYADPTAYTFYADYTGYNFCVKRYNGENQSLFTDYSGITVQIVGNFTTLTVSTKYNSEPSSPDKRTNYLYIQDGNLYVHIGAIPGERCVYSNGSYIIFPPSSVGVVVNVGDLSISTVLSVDYTAIWSEIKVSNDEISSSIYTLSGEFSQIQQRSDLISLKVGNEKTQQRINLLSNAFINRVFETTSSASDSYEISKVRLEANHWYILSAEALEADTREELAVYLNLSTSYVSYYSSKYINGSYRAAAVQGFSNVLFERKATLFKMGSTTMETNVFGYAPSGYARKSVLKYAQIEDVTDIVNKIDPTSYELSQGTIAGATFDEFAEVMASPYSLGPEDYSINASLVLSPKCYTIDSTGSSDSMTTETVTLPNGTKATAYDLTFNNATGTASASYYKELEALSNNSTVLVVGKTYTMSFWAKGSPASIANAAVYLNAANFFYPAAAPNDGTYKAYGYQGIQATLMSVSESYWKIDSATWKFYQITFTVLSGHTTDYCIFLRNYGGTLKIACPKLELGGRATEFNDGVSVRELLATGIDIRDGVINLTAGKVNFIDNNGNQNTKVWIDSTDGTLHAVGGVFSGFIKRERVVISQENQAVYYDYTWGNPVINFKKTGSFIDLYGWTEGPEIALPLWSERFKDLSSYTALSSAEKQAYKDDVFSYIGLRVLIYNRSGFNLSFLRKLTNSSYGTTIINGYSMLLECVIGPDSDNSNKEVVYWEEISTSKIVDP